MHTTKRCLAPGMTPDEEDKAQHLSPFELKNDLIDRARKASQGFLNAGRGNPNFLNTLARRGFAKLMEFAVDACLELRASVALRPVQTGIHAALLRQLQSDPSEAARFLVQALTYAIETLNLQPDEFVYQLVDGILGDFYPSPPRILPTVDRVVGAYLNQVLLQGQMNPSDFDYFATEGGTAGMVYAFKSLEENFLIDKGEKVAIITPIFSPYLEIPLMKSFNFEVETIEAAEEENWQIPEAEIRKLEDPAIKILYMVNPTNPTAVALSPKTLESLAETVRTKNPNLIILVDAVYATFVSNFRSLITELPENCLIVYSFSKYFGATGWRLGTMMLHKENVIDGLIRSLPNEKKTELQNRYGIVSEDVEAIRFVDRLVLDSRDVALAHTAGLSCPQQVMMALFALHDILHQATYKPYVRDLIDARIAALYKPFNGLIDYLRTDESTHYYALIDLLKIAEKYEPGLGEYMSQWFYPVDFVYCLAIEQGCVCLPGMGFFVPKSEPGFHLTPTDQNDWSIRVSLANLTQEYNERQYSELGTRIMAVLDMYKAAYDNHRRETS